MQVQPQGALTVFYDGACPLCRREIDLYRRQSGAEALDFVDVNAAPPGTLPQATTRAQLLSRLHVADADGRLLDGAAAFFALWQRLPAWRWLGRLGRLRLVVRVADGIYSGFLRVRPSLQRAARRLEVDAARRVEADLRSDHAGETGAVQIYRGVLAVTRDPALRAFAGRHLAAEQEHLALIEAWLPAPQRSRLLVGWRVAGWLTGALPAYFGARAVYATVAAVETFVDRHYGEQIARLSDQAPYALLVQRLRRCQADECHHRDEAAALAGGPLPWGLRAWCRLVGVGSSAAVALARRC
jgi:demethoxyubiquinone hydroxylase (CLK1/Coq7/Cat5 family)